MHVLITVNAAWNVANFRWPVVQALLARGDQVTVLAPPDEAVPTLKAAGIEFIPLAMRPGALGPFENLSMMLQIWRNLKHLRPDVVLSYTIKNNLFGTLVARTLGIPIIPNVSGLGTAFLSGRTLRAIAEALYRKAFSWPSTVFFQNADDRRLFVGRGLVRPGTAKLLPGSGIDLEQFAPQPLPPGPVRFLMIARLLRDKGIAEFVAAARIVRATHPEATFQLLGSIAPDNRSGIDQDTLDAWVEQGDVAYLGATADVRPHIAAATCVVLPSYREGSPRTLIEASAMARPVIATDVPGCNSVVDAGTSGLLCEARSAQSLADACLMFIGLDGFERDRMGRAGREKMVAEFDKDIVVDAYLQAIDAAVPGRFTEGGAESRKRAS